MRKLPITLSLLMTFFVISDSIAQKKAAAEAAQQTFTELLIAFNSGDYDSYLKGMSDDIEAYTGVGTPLRYEGIKSWSAFINNFKNFKKVHYDQRQADYRVYGENTVICNAYFVFTTISQDGKTETQSGRETTVMVKQDGKWKIVNFHFSRMF